MREPYENAQLSRAPAQRGINHPRDESLFAVTAEAFEDLFHPDVESVPAWRGTGTSYSGIEGFREMWIDWLEPWVTYRVQVDEMFEVGDRVVVLVRDRARRPGMDVEVELISGSVWTFRDPIG